MNKQFGRLVLTGVCVLMVASASRGADNADHPSHVLFNTDLGDLAHEQELLARRLRHTADIQKFENLIKNETVRKMLKGWGRDKIEKFQSEIKNNPDLLDNPKWRDLLNKAENIKKGGFRLSEADKTQAAELAKDIKNLIGQNKSSNSGSENPFTGRRPDLTRLETHLPHNWEPPPPVVAKSETPRDDLMKSATNWFKEFNQSPEGEKLRSEFLRDLNKPTAGPSGLSSGSTNFLEKWITPRQATWLTRHLKLPSLPNVDSWFANPNLSAAPVIGASSPGGGGLDAFVWVIALSLFGVAAIFALRAARGQAAAARAKAWSAGPWPVHPSRVATREDLIRAFEHLAFLCLGPAARHLNHLDLAGRLAETAGGRSGPAERLAHLYEQARYAPPDELLPADELAAARGDLSTLAGAAA